MPMPPDIPSYLQMHAAELGQILDSYPPLQAADDPVSPLLSRMLRLPYPAQALALMGISKRWQIARNANVIAECGAAKPSSRWEACWCTVPTDPFPG
jgi:hypothetical protein